MTLAFQIIVLVVLFLPGLLFVTAYGGKLDSDSQLPISFPTVTNKTLFSLIFASILHAIWAPLVSLVLNYFSLRIDLLSVFILSSGSFSNEVQYQQAISSIVSYPYHVFSYFVSLYLISIAAGSLLRNSIRKYKWDLQYENLRFKNKWHYILWGELDSFNQQETIDGTIISAIVDLANKSYLYAGLLEDYWFDRNGQLEAFILSNVVRRDLSHDKGENEGNDPPHSSDRYYKVDGNYFIIKVNEIKTINIKYIQITEDE